MATEHPSWDYTQIQGGRPRSRGRPKHGEADPAQPGDRPGPRAESAHAVEDVLARTVGRPRRCRLLYRRVLTLAGPKRYLVFFVIELQTRRGHIAGIHPSLAAHGWSRWPARLLIRLMESCATRHLIHDRDPLTSVLLFDVLTSGGVQPMRMPPKSPISTRTANGSFSGSKRDM